MTEGIIVALITAASLIIVQVVISHRQNSVVLYRLDQIEKKQDKHNGIIEKTYKLEEKAAIQEEQIKVVNHRIADLEEK